MTEYSSDRRSPSPNLHRSSSRSRARTAATASDSHSTDPMTVAMTSDPPTSDPAPPKAQKLTHLQHLVLSLKESLTRLGATATSRQLESWACLIHESMSVYGRYFHSVQHVFDISAGAGAVETISALFHDCIYYNVDGGFLPKQREMLDGVLERDSSGRFILRVIDRADDPMVAMVLSVFGYEPGRTLCPPSFSGENEFLSAVLAVRCMSGTLPPPRLLQIAACIEMTVPFRGRDGVDGLGPADRLHLRLQSTNEEFGLGLDEDELVRTTQRAVDVGNRDVGNFESTDRAWFLDNTWKLLPESNIPLRHKVTYTVCEYQTAVRNMERFFSGLDRGVVFNSFRGSPPPEDLDAMRERCGRNIEVARRYIRAKLLSLSVVSALAALTGGDAPMALFVGDLPTEEHASHRLDDFIDLGRGEPPKDSSAGDGAGVDAEVYDLLKKGRKHDSKFDLRNSPLAAYLYGVLGDAGVDRSLAHASCPMTVESAVGLLESMPRNVVEKIVVNCAKIAITRADKLLEVFRERLSWAGVGEVEDPAT